jgi:hypothetical protein
MGAGGEIVDDILGLPGQRGQGSTEMGPIDGCGAESAWEEVNWAQTYLDVMSSREETDTSGKEKTSWQG